MRHPRPITLAAASSTSPAVVVRPSSDPQRARSGHQPFLPAWVPAGLGLIAVVLILLGVDGPVRAVVVAAALLVVPGLAMLPVGRLDPWAKAAMSVGVSLTVESLLALAMLWTGLWHPLVAGCLLLVVTSAALLVQNVRRPAVAWGARQAPTEASPVVVPTGHDHRDGAGHSGTDSNRISNSDETTPEWRVTLDDGRTLDVTEETLIGRSPSAAPGEHAVLVTVEDATKTVSKTHLALGRGADGLYVQDRGSSNGSTVTDRSGHFVWCFSGDKVALHEGDIVSFGAHWLEIDRVDR